MQIGAPNFGSFVLFWQVSAGGGGVGWPGTPRGAGATLGAGHNVWCRQPCAMQGAQCSGAAERLRAQYKIAHAHQRVD